MKGRDKVSRPWWEVAKGMFCSELAAGSPAGALPCEVSPSGGGMLLLDRSDG